VQVFHLWLDLKIYYRLTWYSLKFLGNPETDYSDDLHLRISWKPLSESRRPIYSYFDFGLKNSSFRLPYQRPSSSADCARALFKGSNGSASLLHSKINFLVGGAHFEWRHKWSSFGVILAHVAWPRAQTLGQSISLNFSLETRLEPESFEPLIDFLAFLDQKLWSKINKLINDLIS